MTAMILPPRMPKVLSVALFVCLGFLSQQRSATTDTHLPDLDGHFGKAKPEAAGHELFEEVKE